MPLTSLRNILPLLLNIQVAIAVSLGADTKKERKKQIFHSLITFSVSKSTESIVEVNHEP